jgi:hypothetical protein
MTKIYKIKMLKQLRGRFPEIKQISKIDSPPKLVIHIESPILKEGIKKAQKTEFSLFVACVHPKDKAEPYTQETLDKVISEYPELYKEQLLYQGANK